MNKKLAQILGAVGIGVIEVVANTAALGLTIGGGIFTTITATGECLSKGAKKTYNSIKEVYTEIGKVELENGENE